MLDNQATSEQPNPSGASESTATPPLADDGDAAKSAKPALRYSYKDGKHSFWTITSLMATNASNVLVENRPVESSES